jgi:hypothetical protein
MNQRETEGGHGDVGGVLLGVARPVVAIGPDVIAVGHHS